MMHISVKMHEYPCEFINVKPLNPLISKCEIKVCYVSDEPNRNRSIITKEVAREMANSLPGSPIVGFYNEEKGDFEEHNRIIDISNGQFKIKDTTRPYGFVDLGAKVWFQKFLDDGEFEREYLMTEGYIWTGQYPESQRIIDRGNNQSMELDQNFIDAHWTKDNKGNPQFFIINEAIISKLCILGEDVEPCFEGASISNLQFSFEDSFKEQLFSMMSEMTKILNEGGTPVFTTYEVAIGSPLWNSLYDNVNEKFNIVAVCVEGEQTFAVLQNREDESYNRLDFSYVEDVFTSELQTTVLEDYVPAEEPQFALADIEAFETEYKKAKKDDEEDEEDDDKKPEDGAEGEEDKKPEEPSDDDDDDEDEEKKKGKKAKYNLEEIPEYVELLNNYSELETKYNTLVEEKAAQDATVATLTEYKVAAERKEKMEMINTQFYMLSDDLKADVIENIDTYSLAEIEAKLSVICVRNKVNFNLDDDNKNPGTDPMTYNLNGGSLEDDATPAWIKAVMATAKTLN